MASASESVLDGKAAVIPALTDHDADFSQQTLQGVQISIQIPLGAHTEEQQSHRTTNPARNFFTFPKLPSLAVLCLADYMDVFKNLTDGKGNVVQPNCDIQLFTGKQLKSVLRLHGLKTSGPTKVFTFELYTPRFSLKFCRVACRAADLGVFMKRKGLRINVINHGILFDFSYSIGTSYTDWGQSQYSPCFVDFRFVRVRCSP